MKTVAELWEQHCGIGEASESERQHFYAGVAQGLTLTFELCGLPLHLSRPALDKLQGELKAARSKPVSPV